MRIDKPCPVCGKWPSLKIWPVVIKRFIVYQLQLVCEDGSHICATSYSEDPEKVKIDWQRTVKNLECKMKGET